MTFSLLVPTLPRGNARWPLQRTGEVAGQDAGAFVWAPTRERGSQIRSIGQEMNANKGNLND
jgi:hypothetical protein